MLPTTTTWHPLTRCTSSRTLRFLPSLRCPTWRITKSPFSMPYFLRNLSLFKESTGTNLSVSTPEMGMMDTAKPFSSNRSARESDSDITMLIPLEETRENQAPSNCGWGVDMTYLVCWLPR